jgi:hypothetical protein
MPKLRVSLAYGVTGEAFASVANDEDDSIDVAGGRTPAAACRAAAKALRAAADRFDLLAAEREPYHVTTQDRVNSAAAR